MADKAYKQPNIRFLDMGSLMKTLRDKRVEYELYSVLEERMAKFKEDGNINYYDTILRTKRAVERFTGSCLRPPNSWI